MTVCFDCKEDVPAEELQYPYKHSRVCSYLARVGVNQATELVEGNPDCTDCTGHLYYKYNHEGACQCVPCVRYALAKAWEDGRGQGAAGATHLSPNPYEAKP